MLMKNKGLAVSPFRYETEDWLHDEDCSDNVSAQSLTKAEIRWMSLNGIFAAKSLWLLL